jgi:hypothetical protein
MPTLILSPRYSQDSNDLLRAINRTKGEWGSYRAIRYQPPDLDDDCCVFGEVLFCDIMAERMNLGLLEPPPDWLITMGARFGPDVLKRWVMACSADALKEVQTRAFFKPASDKVFQYGIYEKGSDVPLRHVDPKCPCLVSEVVDFDIEVRLYLLNRKVLAYDYYRLIGETTGENTEEKAYAGAIEFITTILESSIDLDLPSAVVVDVGHMEGRGWGLVEANALFASGLYGRVQGNPEVLFDALLRASGPRSKVPEADLKYLRNP